MPDQKAIEGYYERAKVVVKNYTQATADVGSVASGSSESITINPPAGRIWKVLNIRMKTSSDADATSGTHSMEIEGESILPRAVYYRSTYDTRVCISQYTIRDANSAALPPNNNELILALQQSVLTPDEGLTLKYSNDTDAAQENDREWYLRLLEIPLERAV